MGYGRSKHRRGSGRVVHQEVVDVPLLRIIPREKMCGRKVPHNSAQAAQMALSKMPPSETLNIYQCAYCNKFHLGNLIK